MSTDTLVTPIVLLIAVLASVVDVRSRRIPNILTFGAALTGLAFHTLSTGVDGAVAASSGWLVGALLFLPFYMLGGMGGGDVKLLAALGAWLGASETFWLAVYTGIAGGVLGVFVAATHQYLHTAIANMGAMFTYWRTVGLRPVPGHTLESAGALRLPYAIPMLVGTVVTLWQ
jgi:prepilin peptidase CpaA